MLKLSESNKLKQEIKEFNQCISQITDNSRRKHYESLLSEFRKHLKIIDDNHSTDYNGYMNPMMLKENINSMAEIRSKFYQLKKDLLKSA